ncbi:hypothetical protein RCL1_000965 [Eukaryota sp. TZLM3-RCL]
MSASLQTECFVDTTNLGMSRDEVLREDMKVVGKNDWATFGPQWSSHHQTSLYSEMTTQKTRLDPCSLLPLISHNLSIRRLFSLSLISRYTANVVHSTLSSLDTLHLESCYPDAVFAFAELCPHVKHYYAPSRGISDRHLIFLLHHCQSIITLRIPNSQKLTFASLMAFKQYPSYLKLLDLSHCNRLTDSSIQLLASCDALRDLQTIMLTGCVSIGNAGLSYLAENCNDIRNVDFREMSGIDDSALEMVAHGCPQLRKCCISNCTRVTTEGIKTLGVVCEYLKSLDISGLTGITDEGFTKLVVSTPELSVISCSRCTSLTPISLIELARHCRQLRSLDVSYVTEVDDSVVIELSINCPLLSHLDLYGCLNVTDESIIELTTRNNSVLTYFSVGPCAGVSASTVIDFVKKFIRLQSLTLSGCFKITDDVVIASIDNCPDLTCLRVGRCSKLTDKSVEYIIEKSSIKSLCIHQCQGISEKYVEKLKSISIDLVEITMVLKNLFISNDDYEEEGNVDTEFEYNSP